MATTSDASRQQQQQPTEFEIRRAELVDQIGDSLDQVLTHMNTLNRSLESIIELGNEFASVEALWSQFETVMESQSQDQGQDQSQTQNQSQNQGTQSSEAEQQQQQQQ